jgi:hypothetical protein
MSGFEGSDQQISSPPVQAAGISDADSIGIGGNMMVGGVGQSGIDFGVGNSALFGEELQKISGAFEQKPNELGPAAEPFGVSGMGVTNKDLQGLDKIEIKNAIGAANAEIQGTTGVMSSPQQGASR